MSNYTKAVIEAMEKAQPLNLAKAKVIATEFALSYRGIISKAKQLKLEYVAKTATASKTPTVAKETKAEVVADIAELSSINFVALDKANMADLTALRTFLQVQKEAFEEIEALNAENVADEVDEVSA